MLPYVSFTLLVLIAAAHSGLGEVSLLRPLFSKSWELDIPREPAERIFRFAWHLTSLAWVGLACVAIGAAALQVVAVVCLLSGVLILVMLRGHLAWPLFLAAGGAAWAADGSAPAWVWTAGSWIAGALAVSVAGLHVYWALGGRVGLEAVVPPNWAANSPDKDGAPTFIPGPGSCLAVAAACTVLAVLLVGPSLGGFGAWRGAGQIGLIGGGLVLGLRAVGDGRSVGFSKREHRSLFARSDDAIYTPLVIVLLLGVLSTLVVTSGAA